MRAVGAQLSAVSMATCEEAAEAALAAADPMAGRDAVRAHRSTALSLSGSTVTLMASPFLTIAKASRTRRGGRAG